MYIFQKIKMKINYFIFVAITLFCFNLTQAQEKIIQLYNGSAPKSEKWNWTEKKFFDDQLSVYTGCAEYYLDWVNARHSAELHLYSKGGHGFECFKTQLPVQTRKDRFVDWLGVNNFIKSL